MLQVHRLLTLHVFVGMVLVPPVLLKLASTTYRFLGYYAGAPAYRRKGPPPVLLRLLGPLLAVLTATVLASGVALLFVGQGPRSGVLFVHTASFVLWFAAMTVHVVGQARDTARLAPRDWYRRTRREVQGAGLRQWTLVASLAGGLVLGAFFLDRVGHFLAA